MAFEDRILVVEDEPGIANLVAYHLKRAGFGVDIAQSASEALMRLRRTAYVLMVLDLMLPEMDGFELCRILKQNRGISSLPIIMLTARDDVEDRVQGLELGADDYITKPFSPKELVARVKAVLRRVTGERISEGQKVLVRGPLSLDPDRLVAYKNDKELHLTVREFKLLWTLAERPGRVFTRQALLDIVWGDEVYVEPRTVDVHIRRLREKVEDDPSRPGFILTKRGAGYYFSEE